MGVARQSAAAVVGYGLGAVPSADLVTRRATGGRVDIATVGSGNPGATNTMKEVGPRWGAVVLVADVAKGALAAGLGRRLAGDRGAHVGAVAAVVGHCHPPRNGFRGGKGVATSVGQVLATLPGFFPIDAGVAVATFVSRTWHNRAFSATAVASASWVATAVVAWRRGWRQPWGPPASGATVLAAATSSVVVLVRFAAEERRLTR